MVSEGTFVFCRRCMYVVIRWLAFALFGDVGVGFGGFLVFFCFDGTWEGDGVR